jgi:SAM-dependent methyltransferase
MAVDPDHVRAAYRLILGREPESAEIVAVHAQHHDSIAELRETFLGGAEFGSRLPNAARYRSLTWPAIDVESECSGEQLAAMIAHIETNWTRLGNTEPHWSVRAEDAFLAANIEQTREEFYASGRVATDRLQAAAERCGVDLTQLPRCCELGCGVGRSTLWLAGMFREVIGADISAPHLVKAREAVENAGHHNVEFAHLNNFRAIEGLPEFDVFVSVIVLQHNPPPVIAYLLQTILGKLRPGGVAYFQVPTYSPGYRFGVDDYLSGATDTGTIEMHVLPQPRLFDVLARADCRPLEIREDPWTGDFNTISNSVFAVKKTGG